MKQFDYYIFIDFSVNLIGYMIIENKKLFSLVPLISKFAHYKNLKHKKHYIKSIKERIRKGNILDFFIKHKIKEMRQNMEIYMDIFEFIKNHRNCIIFISVDDHEYSNFKKFVGIVDENRTVVKPESKLIKNSPEYRVSLVLDTLLNIERLKKQNGKS
jgi:hypothetical protein